MLLCWTDWLVQLMICAFELNLSPRVDFLQLWHWNLLSSVIVSCVATWWFPHKEWSIPPRLHTLKQMLTNENSQMLYEQLGVVVLLNKTIFLNFFWFQYKVHVKWPLAIHVPMIRNCVKCLLCPMLGTEQYHSMTWSREAVWGPLSCGLCHHHLLCSWWRCPYWL